MVGIEGLPSSGKSEPQNIESGHDGMSIMSMCFLVLYMMAIIGHDHYHLDMRHFSIINRGQMEQIDYFFSFLFLGKLSVYNRIFRIISYTHQKKKLTFLRVCTKLNAINHERNWFASFHKIGSRSNTSNVSRDFQITYKINSKQ